MRGPEEIISQPSQGDLVEVSADAIAEAVAKVAKKLITSEQSHYYNQNARIRVRKAFSVNAMLAAYVKVYKAVDISFPDQGTL